MPALAIVNLFLHDVVAGKMAALADAGTPLTSLAGLQQGDIIQTWLATGGLMASAVPVLTLMLVYGGAISANFFATRLQGEDVVMERQAAGATFAPFEQMHVDPARTFDRTAGIAAQTGAESRLDYFSYSSRAGSMHESSAEARMQAVDQFSSDLRQSLSNTWASQDSASVTQGYNQRLIAEGGAVESATKQHFSDTIRDITAQTGMSEREAVDFAARSALQGGAGLSLPFFSGGANAGAEWATREGKSFDASQAEQWRAQIGDKISENDEIRAGLMESVAADIQGNTHDALISSETLAKDDALSVSAQDVVSAGQAYSESISAGASMEASRNVSAKVLIPAIAANPQAAAELNDVIVQNGLAGEAQTYEHYHADRDTDSFGGNSEFAHLYAQAHVASQHIATGEERGARIQAGLADAFQSAEGFGGYTGSAGAHGSIMDSAPIYGSTATEVGSGIANGPAGLDEFQERFGVTREAVTDHMTGVPSAHQGYLREVDQQERANLNEQNDRHLAVQQMQQRALDAVDTEVLDAPDKLLGSEEHDPNLAP